MTKEELEKEAEEYATHNDWFEFSANVDEIGNAIRTKMERAYIASAEPREKRIAELEAQLTTKIINSIKFHLCKQDEDYDKPIISPKFLSDILDQMVIDGFEGDKK